MPAISVIIPLYNQEKFLSACLDSVLHQSLCDIEVIIVNDGSTDKSLEVLEPYRNSDSRIMLINQTNQGVHAARNNGIKKATGEFISFMDPDDYYPEKNALQNLYVAAIKSGVLICGGSSCRDRNGEIIKGFTTRIEKNHVFSEPRIWDFADYQMEFGFWRYIYRRDFLLQNNLFFPPYKWYEDPPFLLRAMMKAGHFYAVPDYVYCHREGHQMRIVDWSVEKIKSMLLGIKDCLQLSKDNDWQDVHAHAVKRLEDNQVSIILIKYMTLGESDILPLLLDIHKSIDVSLLKRYGWTQKMYGNSYNLKVFEIMRQCLYGDAYKQLSSLYNS